MYHEHPAKAPSFQFFCVKMGKLRTLFGAKVWMLFVWLGGVGGVAGRRSGDA